ncbi:MAG: hypothetical protein M1817_000626 [Caeruleum heppii]|nr:MAG: hypothetical protein M1817_000626 [Caeruleum heppii]
MEPRYRRALSPPGSNRRMGNPLRSSTGTLGPTYDPYYPPSRIITSPRTSADRFLAPDRPMTRLYNGDTSPSTNKYQGGYRRPRRSTIEPEAEGGLRPLVTNLGSSNGLRPVVHSGGLDRPSSPLTKKYTSDAEGDYYVTPAASRRRDHRRNFSIDADDAGRYRGRHDGIDGLREPPRDSRGYRNSAYAGTRRPYHNGSHGPVADFDEDRYHYDTHGAYGYGYSDVQDDGYLRPAPARRPRGNSFESSRRERPLSMVELENYLPRSSSTREPKPPPSTRGFDRMNRPARSGSLDRSARPVVADAYHDYHKTGVEPMSDYPSRSNRSKPTVLHQGRNENHPSYPDEYDDTRDKDRGHRGRRREEDFGREQLPPTGHRDHRNTRADSSDRYSDRASDRDEGNERRRHRHRHHEEELAAAPLAAAALAAGHRKSEPRDRHIREGDHREPHTDRDKEPRDRDHHDRDHRERDVREGKHPEVDLHNRDIRERDIGERDARDREGRSRKHRDRDQADRHSQHEDAQVLDLRDRDPRERERNSDDGDRAAERKDHVRVVSPPREDKAKAPIKGILREPREKFPEDPAPIREGVAPLKEALKDGKKGIPPGARWTKIDRKLVNPAALEEAHERFEERLDHVIVLRVLTREEIEAFAARTQEIRGRELAGQVHLTLVANPGFVKSDARYDRDKLDRERRERHRRRVEDGEDVPEEERLAIEAPPPPMVSDPELEGSRRAHPFEEGRPHEDPDPTAPAEKRHHEETLQLNPPSQ